MAPRVVGAVVGHARLAVIVSDLALSETPGEVLCVTSLRSSGATALIELLGRDPRRTMVSAGLNGPNGGTGIPSGIPSHNSAFMLVRNTGGLVNRKQLYSVPWSSMLTA